MRLFVAVRFDGAALDALCRTRDALARVKLRGRMTARENLHLTLAFLGEQPERAVPAIRQAMERAAGAPFALTLAAPGRFRQERGDIWWTGVQPCPPLEALARRLRRALVQAGFPVDEKPFRAHVTLGRGIVLPEDFQRETLPDCTARQEVISIALMQSARLGGALTYTPVAVVPLASAAL